MILSSPVPRFGPCCVSMSNATLLPPLLQTHLTVKNNLEDQGQRNARAPAGLLEAG